MRKRYDILPSYKYAVVEGENTILEKSAGKPLRDYKIYGNSVSDSSQGIKNTGDFDDTTGKYKISITVSGKNLIPNDFSTQVKNGITWTVKYDGTIVANGKATADSDISLRCSIGEGQMYFSSCTETGSASTFRSLCYTQTDKKNYIDYSRGLVVTSSTPQKVTIQLRIYSGYTADNLVFKPMLEMGDTKTDYEPYIKPDTYNILLDEPLRKVGEVADYIDFKNKCLVQNVKVVDESGNLSVYEDPVITPMDFPVIRTNKLTNYKKINTETKPGKVQIQYYKKG